MVIAAILIGIGALTPISISSNAHDYDAKVVSLDAHQHGDVDQSGLPPRHEHPNNQDHHQGNCCHSLVCSGGALFMVNAASLVNVTGIQIPLPPAPFMQGQPIPPSEHPPKLNA